MSYALSVPCPPQPWRPLALSAQRMGIIGLTSSLAGLFRRSPPLDPATRAALGRVTEMAGPLVASVSGFERRLVEPIQIALKHCDELVTALPGMIDINRRAFALDPLIHAFFATPLDIEEMLGRSQVLRDFLADSRSFGIEYLHALFATRRREKHVMGMALQGEMLRQDVPQTLLYFSSHTLTAVAEDQKATRALLGAAAFDSLLKSFFSRSEAARLERQELQGERDMVRAQLRGAPVRGDAAIATTYQQRLSELDQRLGAVSDSLQPEQLVSGLATFLSEPNQALRLEPVQVRVDRNGVMADGLEGSAGQEGSLTFPELVGRDRRRYVVMLARIPRDEAERAITRILDEQRRFILI